MSLPELEIARIGGHTLSWRERGEGPALVLIHGIGGSSESWAPLFAHFAGRLRVIAWDAPGYGASDLLPEGACTATGYARCLAALLEARGIGTAHIVAHSIGAPVAAALARERPGLVASLALVHPVTGFGGLPAEKRQELRAARLADIEGMTMAAFGKVRAPAILGGRADAAVAEEVARIIATIPEAGYRAMVEVMASSDLAADLPALAMPALVLAGADDGVAPPASVGAIADALPDAGYEAFPGIGHYMPLEDPQTLASRLERFLARHATV